MIAMGENGQDRQGVGRDSVGYKRPPIKTRFKKGKSGNPQGPKPGTTSLTAIIRRVLAEKDKKHGTKGDRLIAVAEQRARKGDFRFFKELIDRNDGKVPDRLAGADGEELRIEIVEVTENANHAD